MRRGCDETRGNVAEKSFVFGDLTRFALLVFDDGASPASVSGGGVRHAAPQAR
jgi:hypothetical protein